MLLILMKGTSPHGNKPMEKTVLLADPSSLENNASPHGRAGAPMGAEQLWGLTRLAGFPDRPSCLEGHAPIREQDKGTTGTESNATLQSTTGTPSHPIPPHPTQSSGGSSIKAQHLHPPLPP